MSAEDGQDGEGRFRRSPTGPSVAPPRKPAEHSAPSPWRSAPLPPPPPQQPQTVRSQWPLGSILIFVLLLAGIAIQAYRDLSRPDAWDYWKDQYVSPSLTSSVVAKLDLDGAARDRRALFIKGEIGPGAARWFREKLDEAQLAAGDVILMSSPGGDLNQAAIIGEIIRSRGLITAVGTADAAGRVKPSYCASACVLVYAGGKSRIGVLGSGLGVHRFTTTKQVDDPLAEAQKISGAVLGYMTKMGVSSSVVQAMSETKDIRWLAPKEALAMNLVTDPLGKP
ncbi:hypothetical protein JQ597_16430 [Bradyrhizobium sp. AUGA SZCCT0177]|uniref:COG3904 family protein n=1 Tax=Bradyrhizobium sp. AUGA SZCCT0177 TaxID=2807665 RepID=UPI001BA711FC|nr:hypothetical protein [Bradyrhizobium sp. AUGA SZCCT0177]MBR1283636.1 hypothetical protein [Bradyrhizobium sp. AUGA SZCCT0177]